MNARTIREFNTRTGTWSKCDDPLLTTGPAAPADADNDGMPDFWEASHGLSANDATDNIKDRDSDGYTNIEEYINCVADSLLGKPCGASAIENRPARIHVSEPLLRVSPNPFRSSLSIKPSGAGGRVIIFDMSGRWVKEFLSAPETGFIWNTEKVPQGVYFVRAGRQKIRVTLIR
jgi:hypothetical protein